MLESDYVWNLEVSWSTSTTSRATSVFWKGLEVAPWVRKGIRRTPWRAGKEHVLGRCLDVGKRVGRKGGFQTGYSVKRQWGGPRTQVGWNLVSRCNGSWRSRWDARDARDTILASDLSGRRTQHIRRRLYFCWCSTFLNYHRFKKPGDWRASDNSVSMACSIKRLPTWIASSIFALSYASFSLI